MRADLHVHSTASDGTLSPTNLVELALAASLDVLAIADHDSVAGLAEATRAASGTCLSVIPAVELSSVAADGRDVHILGYFVRADDPHLLAHLADLRGARLRRAATMVERLAAAGYELTLDQVLELSDGGAVGRSHVARALVNAGHAATVHDAFEHLIGHGRPFYVAKDVRTPAEAIGCIREAGGLAVAAHPGVTGSDDLIAALVDDGLAGVEAYHADHTPEQRAHYAQLAARLGLLTTGGSDYHGPAAPNPPLGSVEVPAEAVRALLAARPTAAAG